MKGSNYYGSDLNRFIDEQCSREMTCINIDCCLIKVAQKRIRFIESKHTTEGMKKGQKTALNLLTQAVHPTFDIETFLVRGEYPYHNAAVENLKTSEVFQLDQGTLISWLNFDIELEPLSEHIVEFTSLEVQF